MQYHLIKHARINSSSNAATLYKNLVNIGAVTPKFKKEECAIFAATRPQPDDGSLFMQHNGVLQRAVLQKRNASINKRYRNARKSLGKRIRIMYEIARTRLRLMY